MSLDDLKRKVDNLGSKSNVDQHERIMKEGYTHSENIEHQRELKLEKEMHNMSKQIKDIKNSNRKH